MPIFNLGGISIDSRTGGKASVSADMLLDVCQPNHAMLFVLCSDRII